MIWELYQQKKEEKISNKKLVFYPYKVLNKCLDQF